jgi:hypothetical protein
MRCRHGAIGWLSGPARRLKAGLAIPCQPKRSHKPICTQKRHLLAFKGARHDPVSHEQRVPLGVCGAFLDSLIERGLRGVKFIASDDHAGLKAARKALLPGVPWQRCQFHLQHNAQGYVSRLEQRTTVARQIRGIFNASDAIEAQRLLNAALKDWQVSHPQLAAWAEKICPRGLPSLTCPRATGCVCAPPTAWSA